VAATLAPYAWREFTEVMLARRVLGAVDQQVVRSFVGTVPGADVGVAEQPEPADAGDARVGALVRVLESRRWRKFSLDRLCSDLLWSLAAWQVERDLFQPGSRRRFEDS
jgi:hypothetical protein